MYFIQGRKSADIIKVGGEKVSALEVERCMLSLPGVSECAVVGLLSETWGEKIVAVVALSEGAAISVMDVRRALRDSLAAFKLPQHLVVVPALPRNAMGKVNKKALVAELFPEGRV